MTARNRGSASSRAVLATLVSLYMKATRRGPRPWETSPLGQHGLDPVGMSLCIVLKSMYGLTYDGTCDYLSEHPHLVKSLGLKRVPSRSALQCAAARMEPEFTAWVLVAAGRPGMRGTLLADSTGVGVHTHVRWLDVRDGRTSRRDFLKLHAVTTADGIIVAFAVTDGTAGDAPAFRRMCPSLPSGRGHVILDAAYLSREICEMVEATGREPVIRPKSNTSDRGFDARGRMMRRYRRDTEAFMRTYGKRNVVESVFSSIKRRIAGTLRARTRRTQRTELSCIALGYNVLRLLER